MPLSQHKTPAKLASGAVKQKQKGLWSPLRQGFGGQAGQQVAVEIMQETSPPQLALYHTLVPAGSPAEADDTIERQVTLTDILLHHPRETFLLRVTGDSMLGAGIDDGDLLTVDRRLVAKDGDIVVATIDGQTTVKTLWHRGDGTLVLQPQNDRHVAIEVGAESEFTLLGVVTNVIRALY